MELIKWNDKFATGIFGIDNEHKELIATINSLYLKQTNPSDKDEIIHILNNIYASIHAHFMLEERIMKKHGYDEYEQHRDDHARLLDEIREITTSLEQTSKIDEHQLKLKLNDWFLNHFQTFDSRLHKLELLITNNTETNSRFVTALKKLKSIFSSKK